MVTRAESTVHQIPQNGITRAAIASDEMEFQAAGGGVSGRCTAASVAALGGPAGPTGPAGPAQMPTPYDFGAVGDGTTDDTVAIQAWLDAIAGAAGYGKAGTFACFTPVLIAGNTTIFGSGVGSFIIQTRQDGGAQNYDLLRNANFVNPGDTRLDKNIKVYNTCFQGDPGGAVGAGTALVQFYGVDGFTFQNCLFQNRKLDCITMYNCIRGVIDTNEFYHWGNGLISSGVSGNAINGYLYNYEMTYTNNLMHDSHSGGGIWAPGKASTDVSDAEIPYGFTISNNKIFRVWEFGIVGVPPASVVANNVIVDVQLADVSGHGVEMGGDNYTFTGNYISFCANACAYFNNLQNVVIANNVFNLPCQATPTPEIGALVLGVFNPESGAGASPPHNVTITGNQFSGTDGNGYCAIEFVNFWAPHAIIGVNTGTKTFSVSGNHAAEFQVTGSASVTGSTGNDGNYTVVSATFVTPNTNIVVSETVPNATADGQISGATAAGRKMSWIQCNNNNTGPSVSWAVDPIFFLGSPDDIIGEQFVHRDNNETPDLDEFCADVAINSGAMGTVNVVGVPFRPRRIQFDSAVLATGIASTCVGCVDFSGVVTSTSSAASAAGFFANTSNAIILYDGDGTVLFSAVVSEYVNVGFVIAITGTTAEDVVINYTCYP